MNIPLMNLKDGLYPIRDEIDKKIKELIDNTSFVGGSEISGFEKDFAEFCQIENCVGCSNGTDSLVVALRALGIGPGDTVIVPVNTFIATSEAVSEVGAKIRFIDVDVKTSLLKADHLAECLTEWNDSSVKAVIAVHLYGQMVDMPAVIDVARRYNLIVLEDSAQAHGARFKGKGPGYWGEAAIFSFYPGKNLGAFGDAGAVICKDKKLEEKIRLSVNHGRAPGEKYEHAVEGGNKRIDTLQAAVLRIKLKYLREATIKRREKAAYYIDKLKKCSGIILPSIQPDSEPVWHLFVIHIAKRDRVLGELKERGVGAGIHYPIPLHLQPAYSYMGHKKGDFPVAEKLCSEALSLPLWPEMSEEEQDFVVDSLLDIVDSQ